MEASERNRIEEAEAAPHSMRASAGRLRSHREGLEAALIVMRNGGSTVAAYRSYCNIVAGADKGPTAWRLDFVAITKREGDQSLSVVEPVGPIGVNLARAAETELLGERVARGEVAESALDAELARIRSLPSPYSRWVTIAAAAGTAGAFSQLPGGDWGSLAIAFVAAGIGQFLRGSLQARKLSAAAVTAICGLLSAFIAGFGLRLGLSQVEPATLIAAVIYMVPGLPLVNGFIDVVSHRHLIVGIERIANAAFLFLILAVDIALAHTVALQAAG